MRAQPKLGYEFKDAKLLNQALTHPSSSTQGGVSAFQRLEFLGDAVMQLCVTERLFAEHPDWDEGELTRARSALVREETLSEVAGRLALGDALILGNGEARTGGRHRGSVLADAVEAALGAIYLDGGMAAAAAAVKRWLGGFDARPEVQERIVDAKSQLQEQLQKTGDEAPTYHLLAQEGPPHAPSFLVEVRQSGQVLGQGNGNSKKAAEQAAAACALEKLN